MRKSVKWIMTFSVSSVLIFMVGALIVLSFSKIFWNDLHYKYRFIECDPEAFLSDLERVFDINFPAEIKQVKTARTPGSWDSTLSSFVVKFSADVNTVGRFLESFAGEIPFNPYNLAGDQRGLTSRPPPPQWFTGAIKEGMSGTHRLATPSMGIDIDTTDKRISVVYIRGTYHRDPNEIREELEKD